MRRFPSAEYVIGKTDFELSDDSATVEHFKQTDDQITETGKPQLNQLEHNRFDNDALIYLPDDSALTEEGIYFDKNKVPFKNEQQEILGILGTIEDVTAYKILQSTKNDQNSNSCTLRNSKTWVP